MPRHDTTMPSHHRKQVLLNFVHSQSQSISGLIDKKANQNQQMQYMKKSTAPYCARINIPTVFNKAPYANAETKQCKVY